MVAVGNRSIVLWWYVWFHGISLYPEPTVFWALC